MANRRRIVLIVLFLAIVVLAFVFRGFVRETIAPFILYTLWGLSLLLGAVPRFLFWALFLGLVLVIANRSLFQLQKSPQPPPPPEAPPLQGRVEILTHWLEQMPEGTYFRQRVLRHLANLVLQTHSHRDRMNRLEARERLETGRYPVDPVILDQLQKGWQARAKDIEVMAADSGLVRFARETQRRLLTDREAWEDPNLVKFVEFLEAELEVTREV